ncbi:hypothetical protein TgHK011_000814 [Trichoderma gracile]|nr:hypothetical protein TgHK011_000814 [Trichoderma gracile]
MDEGPFPSFCATADPSRGALRYRCCATLPESSANFNVPNLASLQNIGTLQRYEGIYGGISRILRAFRGIQDPGYPKFYQPTTQPFTQAAGGSHSDIATSTDRVLRSYMAASMGGTATSTNTFNSSYGVTGKLLSFRSLAGVVADSASGTSRLGAFVSSAAGAARRTYRHTEKIKVVPAQTVKTCALDPPQEHVILGTGDGMARSVSALQYDFLMCLLLFALLLVLVHSVGARPANKSAALDPKALVTAMCLAAMAGRFVKVPCPFGIVESSHCESRGRMSSWMSPMGQMRRAV